MTFDLDRFITDCKSAVKGDKPERVISELVQKAVSDPQAVIDEIGEPKRAAIEKL